MHGFYQFKDDKYYNAPVGDRQGLSIFPYKGYHNAYPFGRGLPIKRGRYSKNELSGDNDTRDVQLPIPGFNDKDSHVGGPLPYIYKVTLAGITGKYSCNTGTCDILNREFLLYGVNSSLKATWQNTICDAEHPNGIYIRVGEGGMGNSPGDHLYDTLILSLYESLDHDVDTSYLVLTLASSLSLWNNNQYIPLPPPLLFVKEFAPNETIFALEESIELTPVNLITMDHGIFNDSYGVAARTIRVAGDYEVCNYMAATCTLAPYQDTKYDIRNNHNAYAVVDSLGINRDANPTSPVVTSSGTFDVDKYTLSTAPNLVKTPAAYRLNFRRVTTSNQGQHVPCDAFFNREFILKPNQYDFMEGGTTHAINGLVSRNARAGIYIWDNGMHRTGLSSPNGYNSHYIGMHPMNLAMLQVPEPYLGNIRLDIAGSGGYLELNLLQDIVGFGGTNNLSFRHSYNAATPLESTTFTNWTQEKNTGALTDYCNFDDVEITLEPILGTSQQGQLELSCAPLCNDNTTPTTVNIEIRVSGYLQGNKAGEFFGDTGLIYTNFDETFTIIQDLHSSFFAPKNWFNPSEIFGGDYNGGEFNPYHNHGGDNYYLYYWCSDKRGENKIGLHLGGRLHIPTIYRTVGVFGGGIFGGGSGTFTVALHTLSLPTNNIYQNLSSVSGCPNRYNCDISIPFSHLYHYQGWNQNPNGLLDGLGNSGVYLPTPSFGGGYSAATVVAAYSGVITFDGFV
jgi:hypothetical protein